MLNDFFYEWFFYYRFWGNSAFQYVEALVFFIAMIAVFNVAQSFVLRRAKKLAEITSNDMDDMLLHIITSVRPPFYFFIALYGGMSFLSFDALTWSVVRVIFFLGVTSQVIFSIQRIIEYIFKKISKEDEKSTQSAVATIRIISGIGLWILGGVLILSNFGFNVTSLLAGLGIGGIAIAFAMQNILSDLFSSFSIIFDKPFSIGDFITIGENSGTVKKIGIKTTRLRTIGGEELIISNRELTSARIKNFRNMKQRRASFDLNVAYGTSSKKLQKVPVILKQIIQPIEGVTFRRVTLRDLGGMAIEFEVVYFINTMDFRTYVDIKDQINFKIIEQFEKEKINFSHPSGLIAGFLRK